MSPARKELSERKKQILKAIIDTHINMGEPVGSKYLTQYKEIAFSSATIRNEMAELEEMGYLEQPHTSAGRVPSELGYRFYVDSLMQEYRMTAAELGELEKLKRLKMAELDRIFDRAAKLMSMLTNYTGLALKHSQTQTVVARFDVMLLNSRNLILVMLIGNGQVRTRQLRLGFDVTRRTAERLTEVLNDSVAGVEMDKLTLPVILDMQTRVEGGETLITPIIKAVWDTVNEPEDSEIVFDGVNNLLQYPEYADVDRVKDVLDMLDDAKGLSEVISAAESGKTNVYIGSENSVEIMSNSSFIFRSIHSGDHVVGAIGVIGPRRMDYAKVVTLVDTMSRAIDRLIEPQDAADETDGFPF